VRSSETSIRHASTATSWGADASAATRDFGWKPSVSLAEGLAHYVDWLQR